MTNAVCVLSSNTVCLMKDGPVIENENRAFRLLHLPKDKTISNGLEDLDKHSKIDLIIPPCIFSFFLPTAPITQILYFKILALLLPPQENTEFYPLALAHIALQPPKGQSILTCMVIYFSLVLFSLFICLQLFSKLTGGRNTVQNLAGPQQRPY